MTTNNPTEKSPLPQFACQVCGSFLQQDSSLETIDDQITKPINGKWISICWFDLNSFSIPASSTAMCDESYNELQQGGVCIIDHKHLFVSICFCLSSYSPMVLLLFVKH